MMEIDIESLIMLTTKRPSVGGPSYRPTRWQQAEEEFMQENLGMLGPVGVAQALGRSTNAVKIRQVRSRIPPMSKAPGLMNARQVARLFGVDDHAVKTWFAHGMMQYDAKVGERGIYRVTTREVKRWALDPNNWMCFLAKRISDPKLRRLVMLKQAQWGDEWWTPGQVAEFHGFKSSGPVNRAIREGRLRGVRWGNWWIRRSDAISAWEKRYQQQRAGMSTRAKAFILRARAEGKTWEELGRMMKIKPLQARYRWTLAIKEMKDAG